MLKIKDNVDLKELERLGFRENNTALFVQIQKDNVFINLEFRPTRGLNSIDDYNKQRRLLRKDETYLNIIYQNGYYEDTDVEIDNVIYDLIKADLVEKVGE